MAHESHPFPEHCPNCAAVVHGPYCAQCGQETMHELPTLRQFFHEYLHHYVAAEGKLWHTLMLLMLKPGQLTLEYLAGRRQRYVKPLSLYLTLSFVFFLLVSWIGHSQTPLVVAGQHQQATPTVQEAIDNEAAHAEADAKPLLDFMKLIADNLATPAQIAEFRTTFLHRLPYAVFVLMPLFAGLCAWLYRSRRAPYGLHLLFTLHLHAFFFAVFLLCLIPGVLNFGGWVTLLLTLYLLVALKRVHGGRWWPQVCRSVVLATLYAVITALAVGLVALLATGIALPGL